MDKKMEQSMSTGFMLTVITHEAYVHPAGTLHRTTSFDEVPGHGPEGVCA